MGRRIMMENKLNKLPLPTQMKLINMISFIEQTPVDNIDLDVVKIIEHSKEIYKDMVECGVVKESEGN